MRKKFEHRRNIERATLFKVKYIALFTDPSIINEREFKSLKSMNQWISRAEDGDFLLFGRLALIDGRWEAFGIIGKKCITLSDLLTIVGNLKDIQPSN